MPLQNRVRPDGLLEAVGVRGTMMGNRGGCFHRPDRTLKHRHWASRQWICCVLSFKARRRQVFSPGLYTELFFLDEATALAAGHRPCFECRRADAIDFADAWARAHAELKRPRAPDMDDVLHGQRLASAPTLPVRRARIGDLPDGVFVRVDGGLWLVFEGQLRRWTHEGYKNDRQAGAMAEAEVVTPWPIVKAIEAGYRPALHASLVQTASPPNRPMSSE